jgi:hypothetical protein
MSDYTKQYHSALESANDLPDEELDNYEAPDGSLLFQHDILSGMDERFRQAEVVYTEPAWRKGFQRFMKRAEVDRPEDYSDYIGRQEAVIRELGVPAFMIGGRNTFPYVDPDDGHEIWFDFHDCEAWVYLWNGAEDGFDPYEIESVVDVLYHVVENYDWALDFNCGQGRTARAMNDAGKHAICSDVNGRCIRQIAEDVYGV